VDQSTQLPPRRSPIPVSVRVSSPRCASKPRAPPATWGRLCLVCRQLHVEGRRVEDRLHRERHRDGVLHGDRPADAAKSERRRFPLARHSQRRSAVELGRQQQRAAWRRHDHAAGFARYRGRTRGGGRCGRDRAFAGRHGRWFAARVGREQLGQTRRRDDDPADTADPHYDPVGCRGCRGRSRSQPGARQRRPRVGVGLQLLRPGRRWHHHATPFPVQASALSNISGISANGTYSLAVQSDGTAWSWGSNGNGQLGTGARPAARHPARLSA
jgi:hypothetical protein